MFKRCVLFTLVCLAFTWYVGSALAQPSQKELVQQEAKVSAEIKSLSQKIEEIGADNPQSKRLQGQLKKLQGQLKELKAKQGRVLAQKKRAGQETHVKELQGMLQKNERELADLKKNNPDSPQIKAIAGKLERIRAELKGTRPSRRAMPRGRTELRVFELREVPVEHAMELIEPFVGEGAIIVGDPRTNKLFIKAQSQYFGDIEKLLDHIDVSPSHHHDELLMREEILRHEFEQHLRREFGEGEEQDVHREREEREARRELPPLHVAIRPTEEGPQILFKEEPVGPEDLLELLRHKVDLPRERVLIIHVLGKVDEQIPEEFIHHVRDIAREADIGRVKVEVRQPDQPKERENRLLRVTIRGTEEGPQLFFREKPISPEALAEELHQLDVPAEWALAIHVGEDIPAEVVQQVIDLAKDAGLREIGFVPAGD